MGAILVGTRQLCRVVIDHYAEPSGGRVPEEAPGDFYRRCAIASPVDLSLEIDSILSLEYIRALIVKLPLEQRRVLNMAFFDGLTYVEISEKTGQPLGTVKTRIRSALITLRVSLKGSGQAQPERCEQKVTPLSVALFYMPGQGLPLHAVCPSQ
jgi:DNA-directed RNA polymerase specialized sigma24 family protein